MMIKTIAVLITCISTALYTVIFGIPVVLTAPFSKTGRFPYKFCRGWSWIVLKTNRVRIQVVGREKLSNDHSYVFMSNHASNLDPPAVALSLKHTLRFVAKRSLARIPLFGIAIRLARMIIIDRNNALSSHAAVNSAVSDLTRGVSAFFFAEGTRSLDGTLQNFKKGGVLLAMKTRLPIVPVTIVGSHDLWPKKTFQIKPGVVKVIIGDPIDTSEYTEKERDVVLERVRSVISANLAGQPGGGIATAHP
ncbi:MAG TPA: 1-acyl-sn-glycerol-3-phosphate acyltransferase [Deltaproteobacteria bacterium]|nr:1-acyl-sn-glycerol-3-phosphate acyltransferase [Deltaproteobacteria bacterium]